MRGFWEPLKERFSCLSCWWSCSTGFGWMIVLNTLKCYQLWLWIIEKERETWFCSRGSHFPFGIGCIYWRIFKNSKCARDVNSSPLTRGQNNVQGTQRATFEFVLSIVALWQWAKTFVQDVTKCAIAHAIQYVLIAWSGSVDCRCHFSATI